MRAATTIAKAATRLTWPITRLDRNGDLSAPVVLCYHRVLPRTADSDPAAYAVTPQQFREQMSLLASEGFNSLSLEHVRAALSGNRELPPRSVLVTFDDGFADTYLTAWPIARQFGITLNLFLCTGLLAGEAIEVFDQPRAADRANRREFPHLWRPLNWDEVREMSIAGVGLGFHSHTHRIHANLSREQIAADASQGLSLLAQEVGVRPIFFAFPYGHNGSYSADAISALREKGIEIFFTTHIGRTPLATDGPISRFVIHPEDDIRSFRRKLYGGYDWVGKLQRFAYSVGSIRRPRRSQAFGHGS
ncbi:MAG TPA: polysaccharide deacetylase family protein [Pyrinomonadaceae bacterium]